jgi:4-amino-4-deoxy-L-arabinose transferase-like glycosyltransferase
VNADKKNCVSTGQKKIKRIFSLFSRYGMLFLLVLVKFVLQYVMVNPEYELHRDEFLYLDQAFHPAAGYISVPPFTSWIAAIIQLLGGGLFWVRFFPALFGTLTVVMVWFLVEELMEEL